MSSPERGHLAGRRDAPRRPRHVRRAGVAARRRRRHPVAGARAAVWWSPGWQPVSTCWPAGWWAAGCDRPTCRAGADALAAGAGGDGPQRLRRPRLRDGLGVARRACRPTPGSSTSTTCPRGWCSTWRSVVSRWPRSTAARTGRRRRCWIRRCVAVSCRRRRRRHPDAVRIRLDRNGFPAASRQRLQARVRSGVGGRRRDRAGACVAGLAAHRRAVRHRCTAVAATPPWCCANRSARARALLARPTISAGTMQQAAAFGGSLPSTNRAGQQHLTGGQCDMALGDRRSARTPAAVDDPVHQPRHRRAPATRCGAVEFGSGTAQSDRLPVERQRRAPGRRAASRLSARTTPAAAAARCRDSSRSRTGERHPPTAPAPATRHARGRVCPDRSHTGSRSASSGSSTLARPSSSPL